MILVGIYDFCPPAKIPSSVSVDVHTTVLYSNYIKWRFIAMHNPSGA